MSTVYENHFDKTKERFHKYITIVFILIAAVFLISYLVFFRILISTNVAYMKNNVTQFKSRIDSIELTTNNLASQVFFDGDIQLINKKIPTDEDIKIIHNRLSYYKNSDVYIESINVYDIQDNHIYSSEYYNKIKISADECKEISEAKKTLSYKYDEDKKRGLYSYKLRPYKYMPYVVEINYFLNKFDYSNNDEFVYMIYNLEDEVLINGLQNEEVIEMLADIINEQEASEYLVKEIRGKKQFVFREKTSENVYICYTSYFSVIRRMLIFLVSITGMFLLCLMIIFLGFIKGVRSVKEFFRSLLVFERDFELIYKQKDEIDKLRFVENSNSFTESALQKIIEKYELNQQSLYNMIMLKIDNERVFSQTVPISEQEAVMFSVVNVFEEMMTKFTNVMTITNNNELIIIYGANDELDIAEVIKSTQKFIKENIDVSLSAFICTQSVITKDFFKAYKMLQSLKEYRIYYGNGCIISDSEICTERKLVNISRCWESLLAKFKEKKLDELEKIYLSVIEEISENPPKEFVMANKLLALELSLLIKNTKIDISEELGQLLDSINDMETKEEITNAFVLVLGKAASFKDETLEIENRDFIYQIVEYIEENCSDSLLCRESIAEEFNISVRKIDTLFKDVMLISITNYIKEYRMKKATEYLTQTTLPVSDITKMIGFTTDSHFVYTFRKKFGMTPITYRKTNSQKQ